MKKYTDKELRALCKEFYNIRKSSFEYVEVTPYHHGYRKTYTLKEHYKTQKRFVDLFEMLQKEKSLPSAWCKDKSFLKKKGRGKEKTLIELDVPTISVKVFDKLPQSLMSLFEPVVGSHTWNLGKIVHYKLYSIKFFDIVIHKSYVTHARVPVPDIQSRLDYLHDLLFKQNYGRVKKIMGWKDSSLYGTRPYRRGATNKPLYIFMYEYDSMIEEVNEE